MKRFVLTALLAVAALFSFYSCQQENLTSLEYKIGVAELSFTKEGGVQEFFVQTSVQVNATSNADWCAVAKETYSSDKISKFTVSVPDNAVTSIREAIITVTIGTDVTETIKVRQAANPMILTKSSIQLDDNAQDFEVGVDAVGDFEARTEAYWIEVKTKAADKVVFSAQKNVAVTSRSAEIIFSSLDNDVVVYVTQSGSTGEVPAPDKAGMESDAKNLMKKMTLGINLGNTLEATGGETAWGAPRTTETIIRYFKELGFNAVRIPCSWDQYLEPGEDYIVKDSWMNRVKEVVDYVVDNDMYAILNIHWDGGWLENDIPNGYNEDVDAQQRAIWTQIATTFRDYDEHLVFAGTNEPNVENASQMETLLKYEQTFIDAVRATGGRNAYRVLVFQGPSTDINKSVELMNTLPVDEVEDRLAAEVHFYDPVQFCLLSEDASWGKMMYFWGNDQGEYATGAYSGKWRSDLNEDHVARQMAKMKKKFWDNGIPVIIGEFGASTWKNFNLGSEEENAKAQEGFLKSHAAYSGCVVKEAKSNGCVPFYWHCEGDIIDRSDKRVLMKASYDALIEAGKTQYPN